jgi:hypothetical protein
MNIILQAVLNVSKSAISVALNCVLIIGLIWACIWSFENYALISIAVTFFIVAALAVLYEVGELEKSKRRGIEREKLRIKNEESRLRKYDWLK